MLASAVCIWGGQEIINKEVQSGIKARREQEDNGPAGDQRLSGGVALAWSGPSNVHDGWS